MFFNEEGLLRLDEVVANNPEWKKIMDDGIVTEQELQEQSNVVTTLLKEIDDTFSEDQKKLVEKLLTSVSVLYAAHNAYLIQNIDK